MACSYASMSKESTTLNSCAALATTRKATRNLPPDANTQIAPTTPKVNASYATKKTTTRKRTKTKSKNDKLHTPNQVFNKPINLYTHSITKLYN